MRGEEKTPRTACRDADRPEAIGVSGATIEGPTEWAAALMGYRKSNASRGAFELGITIGPFMVAWALMAYAATLGIAWLYGALVLPAAGLLVRLFMIQHDCGHGSFFPSKRANDWTGRIIGVFTLTPYDYWRRSHAIHHATSGNLDRRGMGDVETLTVREYYALGDWSRLRYRLYRHPAVMFGVGPLFLFVCQHRLPFGFMRKGWACWASTMATNAAIFAMYAALMQGIGIVPFLMVQVPLVLLAATVGVWLFYVQHQFEKTLWDNSPHWNAHQAALHGSSHYDLPMILRWFTANIGVHHVHHLSSRIPFYRLQEVLRDQPILRDIGRVTIWQSFACVSLTLWDEQKRRLVSFRDAETSVEG
jgi:acyl-lipid omega-6 desaturase (Delta-12 desaturase)